MSASSSTTQAPTPPPLPLVRCFRCGQAKIQTWVVKKEGLNSGRCFYKCPAYQPDTPGGCPMYEWHETYRESLIALGLLQQEPLPPAAPIAPAAHAAPLPQEAPPGGRMGMQAEVRQTTTRRELQPSIRAPMSLTESLLLSVLLVLVAILTVQIVALGKN